MTALGSELRRQLDRVAREARDVAERGARAALEGLAVHHHEPHSSMTSAQRDLRARLRAHGRQLGDERDERKGGQQIDRLVAECAYEHWHRMLFARFLAENDLLIEPESGAAVTLDECAELAKGTGRDAWEIAGSFAQRMLPQVFRTDAPVLQVALSPETRIELEELLACLPRDVFLADDSLGWTYQFWQSAEKDRVNERAKAGEKITGRTLPAVTQLFTEHYMVLFLLHNTIGAWWAAKQMAKWTDEQHVAYADELAVRRAMALPEYNFDYLRFVRDEATKRWRPAAGAFESWPSEARALRVLDPCCGSGHVLVATFDLLTRLREREEGLARERAALAVLEANVFGLELDPRCTQIAAFALAFAAWKRIVGVRELPPLRIACSGLAIHGERDAWAKLAGDDALLRGTLESLHTTFAQSPELGSLADPRSADVGGFKLTVDFERLLPLLTTALGRQSVQHDAEQLELGVAAQGLALAAELLSDSYTLVATNVPYLARKSHSDALMEWADAHDRDARGDLSTLFVSRMLRWVGSTGTVAAVTPQNWLFLTRYRRIRERLWQHRTWHLVARLGHGAFETIGGHVVNVALLVLAGAKPASTHEIAVLDVSGAPSPREKALLLRGVASHDRQVGEHSTTHSDLGTPPHLGAPAAIVVGATASSSDSNSSDNEEDADPESHTRASERVFLVAQSEQLNSPDARLVLKGRGTTALLGAVVRTGTGMQTFDSPRFRLRFWEVDLTTGVWQLSQSTVEVTSPYAGRSYAVRWEGGVGQLLALVQDMEKSGYKSGIWRAGSQFWGRRGVLITLMGDTPASIYDGVPFDNNTGVLVPADEGLLPTIWRYCTSNEFRGEVRALDQKLNVTNATLGKVPFDVARWQAQAARSLPHGLPLPQSNDATQWLFHGHLAGMVAAGSTSESPFGVADLAGTERHLSLVCRTPNLAAVLQVAVARIAGYRWPAEVDAELSLDAATRAWADKCAELAGFGDADGIVPLVAMRNAPAAETRVRDVLRAALGGAWSSAREPILLAETARANRDKSAAATLGDWLRHRFFEEHCALFHQRPIVWHIWDGRKKDGFGVLVYYHRLVAPNGAGRRLLEKLTHGYLGDWITRQRDEANAGKEGADARLAAALALQEKLGRILEGEPPYDLFVRWKPLLEQPIGWEPDIDDGVRMNIRPFVEAGVLRVTPKIKWTKDRGSEPHRTKADFPWFWGWDERTEDFAGGPKFTGERLNDLHFTTAFKRTARERAKERRT